MQQFEFHAYRDEGSGAISTKPEISICRLSGDSAARARAGRMAKRYGGPVDLAHAGAAEWNERYITTASPSAFHASGYQLQRLS